MLHYAELFGRLVNFHEHSQPRVHVVCLCHFTCTLAAALWGIEDAASDVHAPIILASRRVMIGHGGMDNSAPFLSLSLDSYNYHGYTATHQLLESSTNHCPGH